MPVRKMRLRDMATFIVVGSARWRRRTGAVGADDEEPTFVEIPIDDLPDTLTLTPLSSLPRPEHVPMTEPPPKPPESEQLPDQMPQARAAWQRAAERPFVAGEHGPVEFPTDRPLPVPTAGSVFLASNYRASRALPMDDRAFIARKTATELMTGAIERVTRWEDVAAILPLFVVTNALGKKRIIFDARALNRLLRESKGSVRYESVRDALVEAAVCTKLDVASAFRHVAVKDEHCRYMCFEVEGVLYRYRTLPFGVSWSPALFFKALAPAIMRVRQGLPRGARIVWYVDDILIVAPDVATLDAAMAHTIDTLLDAGWAVSPEKSYPRAFQAITFLGLTADYRGTRPALRVPESKASLIADDALSLVAKGIVRVQQLQKLAGRLEFTAIVLPQVGLLRRGLDAAIADGLRALRGCVPVADRLRADLIAIAHAAASFHTVALTDDDQTQLRKQLGSVYSDASATGWGALLLTHGAPMVAIPPQVSSHKDLAAWTTGDLFSDHERAMSSGARELRAIIAAITSLNLRDGDVVWHSDATVAVRAISRWRTRSDDVADILRELWDLLIARNLRLAIEHVFRDAELMPIADWLSRRGWRERQAEWGVSPGDVTTICRSLGLRPPRPTADLFASRNNAVALPYCSRWAEPGAVGDAFFTDWAVQSRVWWAFPPISQLPRFSHRMLGYLRAAERSHQLAPPALRPDTSWSVILIYPVLETPPVFLSELLRHASRDILVHVPGGTSPTSSSPPAVIASASRRPCCPFFRLIAGTRPARGPPPWPLRAAVIHVR